MFNVRKILVSMILVLGFATVAMAAPQGEPPVKDSIYGKWEWHNTEFKTVSVMEITDKKFFTYDYTYDKIYEMQDKYAHGLIVNEFNSPENPRRMLLIVEDSKHITVLRQKNNKEFEVIATAIKLDGEDV